LQPCRLLPATGGSTFGIDHPNLEQKGMLEMRGFDGAPMFFLFNQRLPFLAMRTDNMASKSRLDNLNQKEFCHSAFPLFLKETLSRNPLCFINKIGKE
jgi:hypothetical protein